MREFLSDRAVALLRTKPLSVNFQNLVRVGIIAIFALGLSLGTKAKDIYVSQSGSGTTNSLAWLNALANWGGGTNQISAGDTVHLVGTMTNNLTVQGDGTAGHPIILYFERGAKFSASTLPAGSTWVAIHGRSYLVIDGGQNGLIQLTDNGSVIANGGTHRYGNGSIWGINGSAGVNNIVIQNLTIANLYDRQVISEAVQSQNDGVGMLFSGSDVTITNCYITGCQESLGLIYNTAPASNLTVTATTFSNYNHAVTVGSGGATNPIFLNLTITKNILQSGDTFESQPGNEYGLHRNAIFLFNESESQSGSGQHTSGYISNIVIAFNYIKHGFRPQSTTAGSGGIFFDTYNNAATIHVRIYNNISALAAPLNWSGGGGYASGAGTDVLFANNTIIGWQTNSIWGGGYAWTISGTNAYCYNNLALSSKGSFLSTEAPTAGLTKDNTTRGNLLAGVWSDYNVYNHISGYAGWISVIYTHDNGGTWDQGFFNTLSQFQNMYGGTLTTHVEPHGTTALAGLDENYVPLLNDTVARGSGTNLSAFFTTDYKGNPRPASGPWTIGAFEVPWNGPSVTIGVSQNVIGKGQSVMLTWASSKATNLTLSGIGRVALDGSVSVAPSQSTNYVLTAAGPGGVASNTVSVWVPDLRVTTP